MIPNQLLALPGALQAYFIEVAPGADVAFLVALCVAIDEIFQEKKD